MRRRRLLPSLLVHTLLLIVLFTLPVMAERADVPRVGDADRATDPRWAPTFNVPNDTAMIWCDADTICFELSGADVDETDELTLTLISGPISFVPQTFPYQFTTTVCFQPVESGDHKFVWELSDKQNHVVRDSVTYSLELGVPPVIADQSFDEDLCDLREPRFLSLGASGSGLTWELLQGPGSIDPQTGVLTYQPDTSGTFSFLVAVSNICGADTARITDHIVLNLPPFCIAYDTTVFLCDPEQICFEVFAQDPEGDPIVIEMLEGLGTFTQTSDTSGVTCFMPADQAHRVYSFIYYTADSCVQSHDDVKTPEPFCCVDTMHVEVIITQDGELACPGDTTINLCVPPDQLPETVCIPGFMSTWETTTVSQGELHGDTLCFSPLALGGYVIEMIGRDSCGHADTCRMSVTLVGNDEPSISSTADFQAEFCLPDFYCFAVEASDPDGQIVEVSPSFGVYDAELGHICFYADTAGVYTIVVTATDDCGALAVDTTVVTLVPTPPPTVDLGEDRSISMCSVEPVCVDVNIGGDRIESVTPSLGVYDAETGKVCFTPEASMDYTLVVTVTDDCNNVVADTVMIAVDLNLPPSVIGPNDTSLVLCQPQPICLPFVVSDPDEEVLSISSSVGAYEAGQVCFTPEADGVYEVIVTATDRCGQVDADTVKVTVDLNEAPVISNFNDTLIYLCTPRQVCLTPGISDADNDIVSVVSSFGTYQNGSICFVPYRRGAYPIILTVTDACGNVTVDTAVVTVETDEAVNLECPGDTTVFLCEPDTLCFPIGGVPEGATVTIHGIASYWDPETQSICFFSDCCLENTLKVTVTTACGSYSCQFKVSVQTNSRPLVVMPNDTSVFVCAGTPLCLPVGISDIDGNIASVEVQGGEYDDYRNIVCFTPDTTGSYTIAVTVTDSCGGVRSDGMTVNVTVNQPPQLIAPQTDVIRLCELEPVTFAVSALDEHMSSLVVTASQGEVTPLFGGDSWQLTLTPADFGQTCVMLYAADECGAVDSLNFCFTVEQGGTVAIGCPASLDTVVCQSGQICIDLPVEGIVSSSSVNLGEWTDGRYCIDVADDISALVTLIVDGECNSDTCTFALNVIVLDPPVVQCPGDVNVALCGPDTLNLPLDLSNGVSEFYTVSVSEPAWVSGGESGVFVSVPVLEAGSQTVRVIYAADGCAADTCEFTVDAVMNSAPEVHASDTTLQICTLHEICIPYWASDVDGNLDTVYSSLGLAQLHSAHSGRLVRAMPRSQMMTPDRLGAAEPTGEICFTPPAFGEYMIDITAVDTCGIETVSTITVTVIEGGRTTITCPETPVSVCAAGSHCVDVPITGDEKTVTTSLGAWADGVLCVDLAEPGIYDVTVIATAECEADTCVVRFEYLAPAEVICATEDVNVYLCEITDSVVSVPVTITGDDLTITVTPDGAQYADGMVRVPILAEGPIAVNVAAANACSRSSCGFTINVDVNDPPVVIDGIDTTVTLCELSEICLPFEVQDTENNIVEIRTSLGVVDGGQVCFTPDSFGEYSIIITAVDSCGAIADDTATVNVVQGQFVSIACPTGIVTADIDLPGTAHIPLDITPYANVDITVLPNGIYDTAHGELVVSIAEPGSYNYTIIAAAECNTDTCALQLEVRQYVPPVVHCIGAVDTALCLVQPDTLCLPVTVLGSNVQVSVSAPAYYSDGSVCLPVEEPGEFNILITAYNDHDTATCTSSVVVTGGNPPVLVMPDDFTENLCEPGDICFDVTMQDTDFDIASVNVSLGNYDLETGKLCFPAEVSGRYVIVMTVGDDCDNTVTDTTVVTVNINQAPTVDAGDDIVKFMCQHEEICIPVTVVDDGFVTVTTSLGVYNGEADQVCFTPEAPGLYTLVVSAVDECQIAAADTMTIDVDFNEPPVISGLHDTSIYLCSPRQICLPVSVTDANNNIVSLTVNRGTIANGSVCFVPYGMGTYPIIVTAVDACGERVVDTAVVEILTDQAVHVICPGDTTVFLCEPDTLCFPIYGVPDGAQVTVRGIASRWDPETQSVCFYSDCCLENTLTVTVTTACGSHSCSFRVSVQTNTPPLVFLPSDTTIVQCSPQPVCLPLAVNDIDGNLADVQVTYGNYDDYRNEVCFTPDTPGTYVIGVTATDSCGGQRVDEVAVTIQLNEPPVISYTPIDTVIHQCAPQPVCIPVSITDADHNLLNVTVQGGVYNASARTVCITPTGVGHFCAVVTATDACGLVTLDTVCIDVALGDYVDITCPSGPIAEKVLCETQTVCVDLPITGQNFEVSVNNGVWENNQVCFTANVTGNYDIVVIATADCNADTCRFTVPVKILEPLAVQCPADDAPFLCGPDTLCYNFTFSPATAVVTVSAPAYISGNQVCVPVWEAGLRTITITATNQCGQVSCDFDVTATFNAPPVVTLGADVNNTVCALTEVCVPLTVTDVNSNIARVTTSLGTVYGNSQVCFTPAAYGTYQIIVTATDQCGAVDIDTAVVTITEGNHANIQCPDGAQYASVCGPDTVCIIAPITPSNAVVTVKPNGKYNPATGEICVYVTQGGTHAITVIAAAQCGSDTCQFNLGVDMGIPPAITCPDEIDTLLCLAEPTELCIPVPAVGTGLHVSVTPSGEWQAGTLCVPISQPGKHEFRLIATGTCGADTCKVTVNVTADQLPVLTLPPTYSFERCPDDTNSICISGIFATDTESDVVVKQVCGPEDAFTAVRPDSGKICFVPDQFGLIEFCFEATDGCHKVEGSFFVDVVLKDDCDVCVRVSIDGGNPTPVGLHHEVDVNVETNDEIAGFELLISYDNSGLSFQSASMHGGVAETWEYFTWNMNVKGGSTSGGLVRFVGIADRNNGAAHPPDSAYHPQGTLFKIDFLVVNDQNLGDMFLPISFYWLDCADNTFSDRTGRILYIDSRIFNAEDELIWDEFEEAQFPEGSRIPFAGAPDSCIQASGDGKPLPLRCIEFYNGGVKVIDPDDIDDRGDINLNGISYEIADAVVFSNYFIHGLSAFTINVAGQVAATDVNADGVTLTVADLTLLIRVIIGDANPIPKIRPYEEEAHVISTITDNMLTISTETVGSLGAAYFVYDLPEGVTVGDPIKSAVAGRFTVKTSVENGKLKLLLYDIGTAMLESGTNELVRIPLNGIGKPVLHSSELADYFGQPYVLSAKASLPTDYMLMQNYPNPFNPTTTISFMLPQASEWSLRVYNITGALVTEYNGSSEGGQVDVVWDGTSSGGDKVASGVYFYRLDVASYSETKKMILLK